MELKSDLIQKYRQTINTRYQYKNIKDDENLPAFFTKTKADELRNFFLDNLYPEIERRKSLDAAFERLSGYVNHPAKIWGILGNLTSAIFKFGILFPKAIVAGIETLKTHTEARNFETKLLEAAQARKLKSPITEEQLLSCIADLQAEDIERFLNSLRNLFLAITNTKMLEKTILILKDVAEQMGKHKSTYDQDDINAILLGVEILTKGNVLMKQYNDSEKRAIVDFVAYNEMKFVRDTKALFSQNIDN